MPVCQNTTFFKNFSRTFIGHNIKNVACLFKKNIYKEAMNRLYRPINQVILMKLEHSYTLRSRKNLKLLKMTKSKNFRDNLGQNITRQALKSPLPPNSMLNLQKNWPPRGN